MAGDHGFHADDVDVPPERVRELHERRAVQLVDVREPDDGYVAEH